MKKFTKRLAIGKEWESKLLPWMENYLGANWEVEDTSDVYRDNDGDQFPDFMLTNTSTAKQFFLDAKKRFVYRHRGYQPSFGFDKDLYTSYTNIAKKYDTIVYVSFYDPLYDPNSWYCLNLNTPPDFIFDYGDNGHGQPICYRWYISSLKKFELNAPVVELVDTHR